MARGDMEFFARCAAGFEDVLAQELSALSLRRVRAQVGGVSFVGKKADAYACCLWSRVATRVQLVVARVDATDAQALYEGVRSLAWERHLREGATLAVSAHGTNEELRNTAFVALKVKDAICDRLREVRGSRPDIDGKDPDFSVNVAVHPKKATVYVNLSGASLHRRGYRQEGVQSAAPLKETLAAGMLLASGWREVLEAHGALVDPMCGSGTLAIEAAMMLANIAPQILRTRWGFEGWEGHDEAIWERVWAHAAAARDVSGTCGAPVILAGDIDQDVVELARANAERAGVDGLIDFFCDDATNLGRHLKGVVRRVGSGLLVVNPPYGERLLTDSDMPGVRAAVVAATDALPRTWGAWTMSSDAGIESALGRQATTVLPCHNGPIPVDIKGFDLASDPSEVELVTLAGTQRRIRVADPLSAQFAARFRKAARDRLRWAGREGITCLRLYDADVPDFALTIDLFEDVGGARHVLVAEYPRPAAVDERRSLRRLFDAQGIVAAILCVEAKDVVCRAWERAGAARPAREPERLGLVVSEAGVAFDVDLAGKPDCGLPLDERGLRAYVSRMAKGRRVACAGGLASACAVVASSSGASAVAVQEAWPDRVRLIESSLARNHNGTKRCVVARSETDAWIAREQKAHRTYDLVVLAPQLRASDDEWVRRLERLAQDAATLLSRTGVLVCCWRAREGSAGARLVRPAGLACKDISPEVSQADFTRSRTALHCLECTRDPRRR